ncbi:hypothetical protein BD413DRAFT_553861 [Trametes elegans]|nr:hypothetical protein BD413DRAFT_553861 [Trametes elegans]
MEALLNMLQTKLDLNSQSFDELRIVESTMISMIRQVRQGLNARSPVNRLPTELSLRIFEEVVDHGRVPRLRDSRDQSVVARARSLNTIIQVCRRWRERALGAPALWARVDYHNVYSRAFLLRSGSLPLSLSISFRACAPFMDILESHGLRLRNLYLTSSYMATPGLTDIEWRAISSRRFLTPVLECLILFRKWQADSEGYLSTMLSRTDMPRLKALAVHSSCFWWAGHFPHLTHLYLYGERLPVRQLLDLLATTPALQYLHLTAIRLEDVPTTTQPKRAVLGSLRVLVYMASDLSVVTRLLARIRIPPQIYIRLAHTGIDVDTTQTPSLYFPTSLLAGLNSLDLVSKDCQVATGPQCGFWWHTRPDRGGLTLTTLLPDMHHITTLRVYGNEARSLNTLLPRMPSVTRLGILAPHLGTGGEGLWFAEQMRVVWSALSYRGPAAAAAAVCPQLKLLRLESALPYCWSPPELVEMAESRAAGGIPLRRITVHCVPLRAGYARGDPVPFRQLLAELEGTVEVVARADTGRGGFRMDHAWEAPEAERYWRLASGERAVYPKFSAPRRQSAESDNYTTS